MKKKIVVLAGNREQFHSWIRHNIIAITNPNDINRLRGIKIESIYKEGTWYENLSQEILDEIYIKQQLEKEND